MDHTDARHAARPSARVAKVTQPEDVLRPDSHLPRIAMISTHGYVAAQPPLGTADTGGQVVYVLELSNKLSQFGYEVDIWTRQFEHQPEVESVAEHVRIIRVPCGKQEFIPKEYLYRQLPEWGENALRFIQKHELKYEFINSHYWDAGLAGQHLSEALDVPHVHTPHSLGIWKKRQMENDYLAMPRSSNCNTTSQNESDGNACFMPTRIWSSRLLHRSWICCNWTMKLQS